MKNNQTAALILTTLFLVLFVFLTAGIVRVFGDAVTFDFTLTGGPTVTIVQGQAGAGSVTMSRTSPTTVSYKLPSLAVSVVSIVDKANPNSSPLASTLPLGITRGINPQTLPLSSPGPATSGINFVVGDDVSPKTYTVRVRAANPVFAGLTCRYTWAEGTPPDGHDLKAYQGICFETADESNILWNGEGQLTRDEVHNDLISNSTAYGDIYCGVNNWTRVVDFFSAGVTCTNQGLTQAVHETTFDLVVTAPLALPTEPTVVTATAACGATHSIDLSYNGGTGATSYTLYRGTVDPGPFTEPASPPYTFLETQSTLSLLRPSDSIGLTGGTTYFYQVMATNSAGNRYSLRPVSAKASAPCTEVNDLTANGSCTLDTNPISIGQAAVWRAPAVNGGTGSYSYLWSGHPEIVGGSASVISARYTAAGSYTGTVTIASGNQSLSKDCVLTVTPPGNPTPTLPDLIPFGASVLSYGPNRPLPLCSINPNGTCATNSTVTFQVQPQNVGPGFTGPDFKVKLQKKTTGTSDNFYTNAGDMPTVSGGLAQMDKVDKIINYSADATAGSFDFRYCVDLPPYDFGVIDEGPNHENEGNNCSDSTTLVFEPTPPDFVRHPEGLLATAGSCLNGTGKIDVTWDQVSGVDGYRVYRGLTIDPTTLVGNVGAVASPKFSDSGLSLKTNYYYKVVAYKGANVSTPSVSVVTQASETCPDLTIENVEVIKNGVAVSTVAVGDAISFKAVVKNSGGIVTKSFNNKFIVDGKNLVPFDRVPLDNFGAQVSMPIVSSSKTVDPGQGLRLGLGLHKIVICADQPPDDGIGAIEERNASGNLAESNNCSSEHSFTVSNGVSSSVNLKVKPAGTADSQYGDSAIVEYGQQVQLKSVTSGFTTCTWVSSTDGNVLSNPALPETVTQTSSLVGKIAYTYQLSCH